MGKSYYTINGWNGLSSKGKFHAILILIGSAVVLFFAFEFFYYNRINLDLGFDNLFSFCIAIIGGWLIQMIAIPFLDKNTYVRRNYYCADCGNFLGYTPRACSRCGCNRYTESDSGVGRTVRIR